MSVIIRKARTFWASLSSTQKNSVVVWFWFAVLLGMVPIGFAFVAGHVADGTQAHPIRHGDIYLLAATLSFVGVGEMFRSEVAAKRVSFLNIGGAAVIVGVFDALLFALVSATAHPHNVWVNSTSGILYVVSALCSLGCVVSSGG